MHPAVALPTLDARGQFIGTPDSRRNRDVALGCLFCGGQELRIPYPEQLPWLAQCTVCGLRLVDPQPSDNELGEIYNGDYYATFGFDETSKDAYRQIKQATFARLLRLAQPFVGRTRRLLDVGSGVGDLLVVARNRGWEAIGIEPNLHGAALAEATAPSATITDSIESYTGEDDSFELVTCLDVIEHLRRPDLALVNISRLLAPRGILMITTPDVGSLAERALGATWPHYHLDHLWYFSRSTLRRLLEHAGLEIVVHRQCWKTFNLRYVLGILAAHSHTGLLHRCAAALKCRLPGWLFRLPLPMMPEGQLILARKVSDSTADYHTERLR